jgi:hypothetical protein
MDKEKKGSDKNKEEELIETKYVNKLDKNTLAVLIVLVALLLIMDFSVAIFYFGSGIDINWNFGNKTSNGNTDNNGNNDGNSLSECSDGTRFNTCSKNKPFYCYQGQLIKKASLCGCPSGYKKDFQDCVEE